MPQPVTSPILSPGTMRFLKNNRFDEACLIADILDLAVQGFCTITINPPEFIFVKTKKPLDAVTLPQTQQLLYREFFT